MRRVVSALVVAALALGSAGCGDSDFVSACMERHQNADGTYGNGGADGLDEASARNVCEASEEFGGP